MYIACYPYAMNTIRLSATSARNNFFDLLNQVLLGKKFIIERDNKEVAIIMPRTYKTDWKGLLKASKAIKGILPHYQVDDNPLRRKGAKQFLGKWDDSNK